MRFHQLAGMNKKRIRERKRMRRLCLCLTCSCLATSTVRGEEETLWAEFQGHVLPAVETYCYPCHGNGKDKGDIALDAFQSLHDVRADDWTWELVQEQVARYAMPPEDEPQPTAAERQTIAQWIDQVLHPTDCDNPDPGRVTLRRLNRVEYDLTIRDLIGVEARAGKDFPPDDTGYGFDNIAEVLSVSPLLMEKYLASAESILERALVTESPPPPRRSYSANQLQGGAAANEDMRGLYSRGEVLAKHDVSQGGRLRIQILAGQDAAGDEPARMQVSVNGEPVGTVEVTAPRDRPAPYDLEFTAEPGRLRVTAAFVNDFYLARELGQPKQDRNLYVAAIEITGPLDLPPPPLPESHRRIMICEPDEDTPPAACAREILGAFTRRAYRRPPRDWELDRLVELALSAAAEGKNGFVQGIQVALHAVLVSPQFLFRSVEPPTGAEEIYAIDEYALASRLSYFLWSSMPDEELLRLAEQGRLRTELTAQVSRMLMDPKADALARNFAGQWLQTRNLAMADPAPDWFPSFDEELRTAMGEEARSFFAHIVRDDRSILEFLDTDYTFVNERLAAHYGFPNVTGNAFRKINLPDRRRGGLLTQAGVLTVTSNPNRTSPVKRGKWVLENLLGTPPPSPPDDIPALPEAALGEVGLTQRERLAQHREDPVCASCHSLMDPIGFSLEHYDGIGAWRNTDAGQPIDATGTLVTGESFDGMSELRDLLLTAKRELFVRCLVQQMLTYALGRGLTHQDRCAVDRIVSSIEAEDYRFSALVQGVVASVPFQKARRTGIDFSHQIH